MDVSFKPTFLRQFNRLESALQDEVSEKVDEFKKVGNHKKLKVHKLKGTLRDYYSFSVNYKTCIVFSYITKTEVVLLSVGNHDIYK